MKKTINNLKDFEDALAQGYKDLVIAQSITVPYSIHLQKGVTISGIKDKDVLISFNSGEGFSLEGDNKIMDLAIQTNSDKRAIYIQSNDEDLGTITLSSLIVTGQVQILTRAPQKFLNLEINKLNIVSADSRLATEKPLAYGVTVYQGALTVYNYNQDPESLIEANIYDVSIGCYNAPVIGTGIFIGGFGYDGGKVELNYMSTNSIYSNGMIPFGQPTLITAGIFIVSGAYAKQIETKGTVTTYGVNDMVLDVWGEVEEWICKDYIRSFGTSGIGFVNFGLVHKFVAHKPIETYGSGARGFNQYDGTIESAEFHSILTYGDGSIGMQFSKPVGNIKINHSIETYGGSGESLVKGQIQQLDAIAISLKPNGKINSLEVAGNIATHEQDILALAIEDEAEINHFSIGGNITTSEGTAETVQIQEKALLSDQIVNIINNSVK